MKKVEMTIDEIQKALRDCGIEEPIVKDVIFYCTVCGSPHTKKVKTRNDLPITIHFICDRKECLDKWKGMMKEMFNF